MGQWCQVEGRDRKGYHLDLHEGLCAVVEEVARLPAVDTDDSKQELTAETQGHWAAGNLRSDNDGDVIVDLILKDLILGKLLL